MSRLCKKVRRNVCGLQIAIRKDGLELTEIGGLKSDFPLHFAFSRHRRPLVSSKGANVKNKVKISITGNLFT